MFVLTPVVRSTGTIMSRHESIPNPKYCVEHNSQILRRGGARRQRL